MLGISRYILSQFLVKHILSIQKDKQERNTFRSRLLVAGALEKVLDSVRMVFYLVKDLKARMPSGRHDSVEQTLPHSVLASSHHSIIYCAIFKATDDESMFLI